MELGIGSALCRLPDFHCAAILRGSEQLGGRRAQNRMPKFGGKLNQGNQDKTALRKARVRNLDPLFLNYRRFVKKDIEINDAWAAWDKLPAAELAFDCLQPFQQLARLERSFGFNDAIQKPRLGQKIDRLSLVVGRAAQNSDADFRQGLDRAFQIRRPIAQVRPERKIDEFAVHHTRE